MVKCSGLEINSYDNVKASLAVVLLISALLTLSACSGNGEITSNTSGTSVGEKTSVLESTGSTVENTRESTISFEETTGQSAVRSNIVLRLEGDPKTSFSGICKDGGSETVLKGKVPKRFDYDLVSGALSCRIQKQDAGKGKLKVTLVANDATRSVQQTDKKGSTIKISYKAES